MKFHETEEFKKQQKEWYQRLKESGFKDIEVTIGNEQKLLQYSTTTMLIDTTKLCYYQALTYYVHLEEFDNKTDELIMFMRADGIKIKDISTELKNLGLRRSHRETIRYIIRKYEVLWGIMKYKPNQLSSKRGQIGR